MKKTILADKQLLKCQKVIVLITQIANEMGKDIAQFNVFIKLFYDQFIETVCDLQALTEN